MKKILIAVLIVFIIFCALFYAYLMDYYKAEPDMDAYLNGTEQVKVTEESEYFFFDASGDEDVLIFYPGAKIEEKAYAKLMTEIARNGIDCYLVKLPFRLAFFNANGADYILKINNYENVYIGGHSLGGVVAGNYAYENMDKVDGLVLIESRASVQLDDELKALSIYATNDGVMKKEAYEEAKKFLPKDYKEVVIEGGNHANVANYGEQKGDNQATISKEEQQKETVEAVVKFIKN